jgi:hypothetical protein
MRQAKFTLSDAWIGKLANLPFVVAFLALFFRYVPWLFGSEPIEKISNHSLENLPPPGWASSFAINHGRAIYFEEAVPSEEPGKLALVISYFAVVIVAAWIFGSREKRNETAS